MSLLISVPVFIHRLNTTSADVISNISVLRYTNLTEQWGGAANDTISAPNWGQMVFHIINIYPDMMGQIAWVILFSIPFVMMWLTHDSILSASTTGIFLGIFVYFFIGSQFQFYAIGLSCLSLAVLIWSIMQKRG